MEIFPLGKDFQKPLHKATIKQANHVQAATGSYKAEVCMLPKAEGRSVLYIITASLLLLSVSLSQIYNLVGNFLLLKST